MIMEEFELQQFLKQKNIIYLYQASIRKQISDDNYEKLLLEQGF